MSGLPVRPSAEHLRKQAKRLARDRSLRLAEAQRLLANEYGFRNWAELMRHVAVARGEEAGPSPRLADGRETPLHAAARRGPLALVETLIAGGALEWQTDAAGRTPLDVARRGRARQRSEIVALLDRSLIADPSFRAAVDAIHAGDVAALGRLLEDE